MVRIAIMEGTPAIDEARRVGGRGGYLHRASACLEKFVRSKVKVFRSLRRTLGLDDRRRLAETLGVAAGQLETAGIR